MSSSTVCSWTVLKIPIAHFEGFKTGLTTEVRTYRQDNYHLAKLVPLLLPLPLSPMTFPPRGTVRKGPRWTGGPALVFSLRPVNRGIINWAMADIGER